MNYYRFLPADRRLTHGDGRKVELGVPMLYEGDEPIKLWERGLHAYHSLLDALAGANGLIACEVVVDEGSMIADGYEVVSHSLTVLRWVDMTPVIGEFAQWCAERAKGFAASTTHTSTALYASEAASYAGLATCLDAAYNTSRAALAVRYAARAASNASRNYFVEREAQKAKLMELFNSLEWLK